MEIEGSVFLAVRPVADLRGLRDGSRSPVRAERGDGGLVNRASGNAGWTG